VRWALDPVLGVIDGLMVEWLPFSGYCRLSPASRPPSDLPPQKVFGGHILTPGFLNAHAHLDYSYLLGSLPRGVGFIPWLKAMIGTRRTFRSEDEPAAAHAASEAVAQSVADGVTEIWDIRSFGWGETALRGSNCRGISFHEWLAPDPKVWDANWMDFSHALEKNFADNQGHPEDVEIALSVHSLYSVYAEAVKAATRWANERSCPLAIHLAESPEEIELLTEGRGGLYRTLCGFPRPRRFRHMLSSNQPPITRAVELGLLSPATLAIHCNLPQAGEAEMLADCGSVVVFCPRSHDFFGYPDYPLETYRRLGVRLALGTDSLASNDSVSIREEGRRLNELAPSWPPLDVLGILTGAALGDTAPFGGRGRLVGASCSSWALWRPSEVPQTASDPARFLSRILDPKTHLTASSADLNRAA
jgi:cytosine/adenosine deaminase-related metal-dependent hydrolase